MILFHTCFDFSIFEQIIKLITLLTEVSAPITSWALTVCIALLCLIIKYCEWPSMPV